MVIRMYGIHVMGSMVGYSVDGDGVTLSLRDTNIWLVRNKASADAVVNGKPIADGSHGRPYHGVIPSLACAVVVPVDVIVGNAEEVQDGG